MDEDTRELVQQLCTRAGMMMEDASLLAVTMTGRDEERAQATLHKLKADAACIEALLVAAASQHPGCLVFDWANARRT